MNDRYILMYPETHDILFPLRLNHYEATMIENSLADAPLGKKSAYVFEHQPDLLFPIARQLKRNEIGIDENKLPFKGADLWNAYELSWLNAKGKPQIALAEFIIPCDSPNIVESKSFKLYLNSFNQTKFADAQEVKTTLQTDLSKALGSDLAIKIILPKDFPTQAFKEYEGFCLDDLDIACDTYRPNPDYLTCQGNQDSIVTEKLYSHLLKSNCLITAQPDWGSLYIEYTGTQIDHAGLLRYIVSLREHNEFNEQCIERIFCNILQRCQAKQLTVYGRYTRRGGLDTNPYRSTQLGMPENIRNCRQ